jgi:hypothetical protein
MFPPSFDLHPGLPSIVVRFVRYFLPAIIARVRAHYNRVAILALIQLLG